MAYDDAETDRRNNRAQLLAELEAVAPELRRPPGYCVHGCGAVVADPELHETFHAQLRQLVNATAELGQLVNASPNPGQW